MAAITERQIAAFRAVMLTGTVSGAARQLHLSQPAVTGVLKRFEDVLGVALFQRNAGRLVPTIEAHRIFAEIQLVHDQFARLTETIRGIANGQRAVFRFGVLPSVSRELVPRAVAAVMTRHPDLLCQCDNPPLDRVIDYLCLGEGECVVTLAELSDPAILTTRLGEGWLVCVAPADHLIAQRREVQAEDLAGVPLVAFPPGTVHGGFADRALLGAKALPRVRSHVRSTEMALALAARGLGVALLDCFSARGCEVFGLRAVRVRNSPVIPLMLHSSRTRPGSRLVRELAAELRSLAAEG